MTERIRRAGQVAWAVVGIAVLITLAGLVAWYVRVVWPPLILAGAIVFVLNPVVTFLQHRHVPRPLAAGLSYLGVAAVVGVAALIAVPIASDQADQLEDELPHVQADVERFINDLAADSEDWPIRIPTVGEIEREVEGRGEGDLSERWSQLREIGLRIFEIALIFLLGPIIAFYLLVDLPRLLRVAEGLIPEGSHDEVLVVAARLNRAIGGFFRGQLLVALIVGIIVSIGLAVIDLPFWLIVGMVAGVFNIIPLIGPWVGAVPGVVIALTTRDVGTALLVAAVMAGAQQIDNHLISPLVMQRAVKLHPSAVMVALLAGGTLGGFLGLLVAVPAAAVLKIIVGHVWHTYVLGEPIAELAAGWHEEDSAPGVGLVREVDGLSGPPGRAVDAPTATTAEG